MRIGSLGAVAAFFASACLIQAQTPNLRPSLPAPAYVPGTGDQKVAPAQSGDAQMVPLPSGAVEFLGLGCKSDTNCGPPACAPKTICGPPGRLWAQIDYLHWWIKDNRLPPLVTTGPVSSPNPGALGARGTVALFGGDDLDRDGFSGARLTVGYWLDRCQTFGVEGSYFFLASRSNDFALSSTGAPGSLVLARPFFDVSTGLPNSELVSFPGLASGTIDVHSSSRLQGGEANLIYNLCCSCNTCTCCCEPARGYRVDLIGGLRFLELNEGLGVTENIQVFPSAPAFAGATIRASDQFDTHNQFFGAQLGFRAEAWRDRWFANVFGKVALGVNHETVDINGATTITPPSGPTSVRPGGLLAQPSNSGRHVRDEFSVVPEVGFNVGYQVTDHLRVSVGYTFLYATDFVRPGDVIDLRVNSTRTPLSIAPPSGPLSPLFTFRDKDFWAQGINFAVGLQF